MRYLKTINELFDSPEIKSEMEVPYLQGKIQSKELVKDKNLTREGDNLLSKLAMNCPYIGHLEYNRLSSNLLNIGFKKDVKFEGDDVTIYFVIEVMEHSKKYICNSYAKCLRGNKILYDKKINKGIIDYDTLTNVLNNEVLDLLIDFTKFNEHSFGFMVFPYKDRNYMSGLNLRRN